MIHNFRYCHYVLAAELALDASQPPTAKVGPYTMANCTTGNADIIAHSLQNLAEYLAPVIKDATSSIKKPSPAFSTFFGPSTSALFVSQLLTNITKGPSILQLNAFSNGAPIFACLTGEQQLVATSEARLTVDMYDQCDNKTTDIFYISSSSYIVACPSLFTGGVSGIDYPDAVPIPGALGSVECPTVNPVVNRFRGNGIDFATSLPWMMLNQLASYYINGTEALPANDTYDINKCLDLTPQESVLNPQSYVYYVASKFFKNVVTSNNN